MLMVKKTLGILGGWIGTYLLFAFVMEKWFHIKLEGNLIGLGFIIWPVILFIGYIIKTVVDFKNKKEIKLARGYKIILTLAITSSATGSISNLLLVGPQLDLKDEIVKNKNNKMNMILNILMYIVTIISLLLVGLIDDSWIFACIVIMYGIVVCIPLIFVLKNTRKARKENIEAIAKEANISKGRLIFTTVIGILIFLIPCIIIGIILGNIEANKFDLSMPKIVQPNHDINVKDHHDTENKLTKKDYKEIEKEISNALNGDVVYKEVKLEKNLKNKYGERYNKILVVANLVTDEDDANSYNFIFYQYLTSSDKHKLGEIELYLYAKSSTIVKKDWYK